MQGGDGAAQDKSVPTLAGEAFEAAEVDSIKAPPGVEDYLENAFLYRRIPPVSFNGEPVDTTMRWFAGSSAAFLHAISRNPGMTGRRKEDDDADSMDGLLACLVTHGRMEVETDGKLLCLQEGDAFTLDTAVPHIMRNYPGHVVAIFVPRSAVAAAVDAARLEGVAGRVFTGSELADLFALQVRYMVDALGEVSARAFDVALTNTADVALAMIRQSEPNAADAKSNLVARVKTLIDAAGTNPELNTGKIASMLNVSRSGLYEAFASQGLTVAAYLRDHRLRQFLQSLRGTPDASIQELALKAGFGGDASDFTKLFRRVYGISPSDIAPRS
ncbi:AraC family transcriptional regulator [Sphingomonas rubra]|uniref:Transcriptional regulator, AraC family n=1 Tax=Sphingomonas rubra TaxID=634430 RepID=A0A1I5UEU1_9SPHN|nr:helix-turn-helix domain-containing protein [Sphingomonas rubra]SFP93810.1 transcriptional regulator, AraC family [Sphingomonas rubra]